MKTGDTCASESLYSGKNSDVFNFLAGCRRVSLSDFRPRSFQEMKLPIHIHDSQTPPSIFVDICRQKF